MYFGYWGLYRYAFNDTLKVCIEMQLSIIGIERPEKDGLWNLFTGMVVTNLISRSYMVFTGTPT